MSLERTQHQSTDELKKARELSLEPTRPPAQVPGYKLQKFLGSGAYGEVWSAVDQKTGRRVAIKFYTRRSSTDVKLLAREVEKLVVLAADRYVVQLLDVGWDADPPFYVMDYIEHGSLEDRLSERSGIPVAEAVELFKEVASGMMHLHAKGILHCDLKPGNVLLDQDGKPRVADFGQSRLHTEETSALGTLFFMAPEQADLDAVPDAKWDVFGLGALLFCMLTGKPPYYSFELANEIESQDELGQRLKAYRRGLESAVMPTEHRAIPGVDRALADIIDRCIEADPKKRFANIQSVLLALRQRELSKEAKPLMLLGLLGPLLLVGVMSIFGWWAFRQAVDRSKLEITNKAIESNEFAARLAARSAAEQINEYFRVVRQLARDEEFLEAFDAVVDPDNQRLEQLRIAIADPAHNSRDGGELDSQVEMAREAFREDPTRKQLQPFLEKRFNNVSGDYPVAASWFVSDRFGNQIASVFPSDRENRTLGNNYSYRSYFSGTDSDLILENADGSVDYLVRDELDQRRIINESHLSAVFISEQTNSWKVAFSTPIVREGEVRGIVAVTVNLGNFVEFENDAMHYAMMIDGRPGENPGIILEHPLFKGFAGRLPDELARCCVDLKSIDPEATFVDPVGQKGLVPDADYEKEKLVAMAEVEMELDLRNRPAPTDGGEQPVRPRKNTGLIVLAVQDYSSIVAPANDLSRQLGRLALLAATFLFTVTIGMWLFVTRMLRESRQRLNRAFSPSGESSLEEMETVPSVGPATPRYSVTERID